MKFFFKSTKKTDDTLKLMPAFSSAKDQFLSDQTISTEEKDLLNKVSLLVHPQDGMYQGNAHHYLSVGLSAIRCINNALEQSNRNKPVRSILDFPCGYGRVIRFLRVKFPRAKISACEIDPEMLNFCKHTFSANTIKSYPDFNKISVFNKFDLIWCGSLITHIDEGTAIELLKFFYNHLSPNGVCIFTTHGQFSVNSIQDGSITYGLSENGQKEVVSQYHKIGYGYSDYSNQHGYGISAVSHQRMISIAQNIGNWKETIFMERGWDNHQDVYGFTLSTSRDFGGKN